MPGEVGDILVAIVDDHPVARYGVRLILSNEPGVTVVCAVGSVDELTERDIRADVTILDLYLGAGRLSVSQIATIARRCPVLVMSASARQEDVLAAVRAGASGYLTKTSTGEAFIEAVRTVAGGGFFVSSQLADLIHATSERGGTSEGTRVGLSPRERTALSLIAQGFTQAQAATRMGISAATIDTYMKRIRLKLGPGNKADLTRRAIELGQMDNDPWDKGTGGSTPPGERDGG